MLARLRPRATALIAAVPLLTGSFLLLEAPAHAAGTPAGPARGLSVVRDAKDPMNLDLSWRPPASSGSSALDRYLVTVDTATSVKVSVLAASQTTLQVPGSSWNASYKIKVSTRNTEGLGSDTGWTTVAPATASAPAKMSGSRSASDPTTATVSWAAPSRAGVSPVTAYDVTLRRVSDGATWTRTTTDTSSTWKGLDLSRTYTLTVQAVNGQGDGTPGVAVIGNDQPGTPGSVVALRDPQDPTRVRLSWAAPQYTGIGDLKGYQVGRRASAKEFWSWGPVLPADQLTATESVDIAKGQDFSIRAVNGSNASFRALGRHVASAGSATPVVPATPNVPVVIGAKGSVVTVNLLAGLAAGASSLDFKLEPQAATTFSDSASAPSDSRQLEFGAVPDGIYLVTVSSTTNGASTVLKTGLVTIGNVGQLTAADWQVVRGSASISGQTVDISKAGEVRVLDTRNRPTEDATVTTTATLHSGSGFGIWTRASVNSDKTESGWSFQVDPGWGNKFIIRWWSHDSECSSPLAYAAFPKGFDPAKPHQYQVSVHGDRYVATVDGTDALVVPSLKAAIATSPCNSWAVPHGNRVGMRSWGTSSSTFVGTTLTD